MKKTLLMLVCAVLAVIFCTSGWAAINDPYEILNRYYQAIGGLDKIKAMKTSYVEGTIVIEGTGLQGTFKQWTESPIKSRQEVDLTIFKQTTGDNGQFAWTVDQNGKVQPLQDERSTQDHQVKLLTAEFDFLNRDSKNFKVTFDGTDTVGAATCYVVRTTNSINQDTLQQYFDTATFRQLQAISIKSDGRTNTRYFDYRDVNGVLVAFEEQSVEYPTMMKQVVKLTTVKDNIAVEATMFEPPTEDVKDFRFVNGRSAEDIPFRFIENHIYLMVNIAGKERLWVLDSGADMTVLDAAFAKEANIAVEGSMKGQGAGQLVDLSFADLPPFSLAGLEFDKQKAAVIDINPTIRQWVGFDIAGILGYDFLSRVITKVDYANEKLSFYDVDSFVYNGPGVVLDAPVAGQGFDLPVTVDGVYGGLWSLDLGAGGMAFLYPFAEKNGLLKMKGVDGLGFGAGGSSPRRTCRFKTIEFAGFVKEKPLVTITMEKGSGAFGDAFLTGNIGNTLLRHFVLYLDYKHGKVIVEKGKDFDRVFPEDHSGLTAGATTDNKIEVVYASPGTPAEKAGFKAGDIITSFNGIGTDYLGGVLAIIKMLREKPGTTYTVGILRDGKPLTLKMTLKDLYE
ncbi:MAG: aspartyl protease family protein [candidate division Zixibacteria bacterium]|nr:aspartyl protease family protein [candidate division Zixibacteria bacterium]